MVTLYQIGRAPNTPSLTPFAIKLETYLRAANIPYKNDHRGKASSKGKVPWISYQGKAIADSDFSLEFLNKERNVDLNSHLSDEQKGAGRAFQKMVEENTYWVLVLDRWLYDKTNGTAKTFGIPSIMRWLPRSRFVGMAKKQGIGRHSKAEVEQILRNDVNAISCYLGSKKFLFGDKISQYDMAVFGQLAAMKYEPFGGMAGGVVDEFSTVCSYLDRIKTEFWPDWDECTTGGGTRKATK
ncbi:failed axon connections homolog [Pecten maximus]|uniref:failed axon connections homolog n=1 Tax=Pecten maximus TaxID=6579 RepID=UPI001458D711|nr:failed axon connections homolog [Pecten maximus]